MKLNTANRANDITPWGPEPVGQGGRPPPQILEEIFSIHPAPPDFGGFCSEMF